MSALPVLLMVAVTLATITYVVLPLLRPSVAAVVQADGRLALIEERDRAVSALKELELDHRTGKVSDDDYRALVGRLRREAAEALRRTPRTRA
jgi:hypothetical protein